MDHSDKSSITQLAILACGILFIFAATLAFIQKNAILSRIGAAVALSCLQYTFYTFLLQSSLPQSQITGMSLYSWGLYANSAEQILLSRYDADDLLTTKEKQSGRRPSPPTLLRRAVGIYFSLRRVGLRGEIPMKKPVSTSSLRFVTTKSIEFVGCYLILDAILLAPRPEGHLITREKQSLFKLSSLNREDVTFRISSSFGNWVIGYVSVQLAIAFISAVSVLLGLCKPEDWPHLFGPVSACSTVRGLWGTFWHRLFRKALTGWGDFIPDRVLGLRRGTLISRYTRLTLTFFTSALMHRCLHYFYRLEAGDWYEMETFFLFQPLAIMFEDAVQAATMGMGITLSRPLRQTVGFIWLGAFLTWVTPTFLYPTLRAPDPGQMLPFSVVAHLMKRS
ncbi:TRI7-trichothecene biosynthesis [Fusarium beomiforme]|uniref:TRI7-trichothecene biosynthesis n=1 Tax=Fusarium beomiforme TaxID=44412 RepID=A0A9P5AIQ4_9HYPO|nr:TRI7-trichothecene biosynthesis [Fusarium beomiforme]